MRWPVPILAASAAVVMLGAIFVPTYRQNYDDRQYQPPRCRLPIRVSQAADRHFPKSKLFSEMLMVEADHDMRNSADFISLDRVAKALIRLPGVAMVQGITRPLGRALEHANIPYLFTTQGSGNGQQLPFNREQNANTDEQAQIQAHSVTVLRKEIGFFQKCRMSCTRRLLTVEDLQKVTDEMNSEISNLDDFFRPIKSYFYWENTVSTSPSAGHLDRYSTRSTTSTIWPQTSPKPHDLSRTWTRLFPQIIAQLKATADDTEALQAKLVNTYGSADLQSIQTEQTFDDSINVGNDFDKSRSDDYFYIPHEGFDNEDVKTGIKLMMSPDGKAARFIVTHEGDAMGPEGVEHVETVPRRDKNDPERDLLGRRPGLHRRLGSPTTRTSRNTPTSDLLIAAIAAFVLIFLIMMFITRSLVAALVIPGTVAFSYAGAFGLSILVWQHLIGLHLHWLVLPLTFIILVAVGSDYNLLLITRVKEELHGGLHTGLIRALGSTGGVVTSAGLVFAFTMLAMLTSDLRTIGQVGSTVCIGLLLDTLIVRSFVVPASCESSGRGSGGQHWCANRPLPQR